MSFSPTGKTSFFLSFSSTSDALAVALASFFLPWYARFPQNVGASSGLGAIPVAIMLSMLPSYVHFPQNVGVRERFLSQQWRQARLVGYPFCPTRKPLLPVLATPHFSLSSG
jgi:hypothetical protein